MILKNKTALVTGASRGIGRSIAERLAAAGALVAINYAANEKAAQETLKAIAAKGGQAFLIQGALGTETAADALVAKLTAELVERTGSSELDILVNNIGGSGSVTLEETTEAVFHEAFASNVGAALFVTRALLPHLRQGGRVINISSVGARLALEQVLTYSMGKGALDVFTRAMAKKLGARGITVNTVSPGYTDTDLVAHDTGNSEAVAYMQANTALGRAFGQPGEIAEVVYALATPALGWVTGQIIEASGGFRL